MPKQIYDPLHGFVELSNLCLQIVDTPVFQRLRRMRQLGVVHYVFPSANHTRFEHSIGVGFLARKMLREISERQPELGINSDHLMCVEIAGLCHDLGHGPWSHLFDDFLETAAIHSETSDGELGLRDVMYHEQRSILIFRWLVKRYRLPLSPVQVQMICDMIHPRPSNNSFLYQIVANKHTGIDVDKFDYLSRDSYYLGFPKRFDHQRIFRHVRVINDRLCYSDKSRFDIYDMFLTLYRMHVQVYRHPVVQGIELLHRDMLDMLPMGRMEWFSILSDYSQYQHRIHDDIIDMIPGCDVNGNIMMLRNKLWSRDGYCFIGEIVCRQNSPSYHSIGQLLLAVGINDITPLEGSEETGESGETVGRGEVVTVGDVKSHLVIKTVVLGYDNDPVENVPFYDPKNERLCLDDKQSGETSLLLPQSFKEHRIRWWCRDHNRTHKLRARLLFNMVKSRLDQFSRV